MSLKSLIQVIIISIIIIILAGVYFNYFTNFNNISLENKEQNTQNKIDTKISKKKEVKILSEKLKVNKEKKKTKTEESKVKTDLETELKSDKIKEINKLEKVKSESVEPKKKSKKNKPKIDNTVKEIEYLTVDNNGNKYKILAASGRTSSEDKNILDLDDVKGTITSNIRSTIYIVSDFAEYNSTGLKSLFYQNVVINYEDKEITCDYFDINMKTNIAIAYNNVVVTDPKSIMKAGKISLDIKTKVITINPESDVSPNKEKKVKITIN